MRKEKKICRDRQLGEMTLLSHNSFFHQGGHPEIGPRRPVYQIPTVQFFKIFRRGFFRACFGGLNA